MADETGTAQHSCHCAIPGKHTDDRCAYGNGANGRSWCCSGRKEWHAICWGCSCACHRGARDG